MTCLDKLVLTSIFDISLSSTEAYSSTAGTTTDSYTFTEGHDIFPLLVPPFLAWSFYWDYIPPGRSTVDKPRFSAVIWRRRASCCLSVKREAPPIAAAADRDVGDSSCELDRNELRRRLGFFSPTTPPPPPLRQITAQAQYLYTILLDISLSLSLSLSACV